MQLMSLRSLAIAVAIAVGMGEVSWAQLTGQFLFEEGPGTTAFDTSIFGRHGTNINGPTYVPGLYPGSQYALQLNSAGPNSPNLDAAQTVVLPNDSNFIRNAPGATIMAWIRLDGDATNDRYIMAISNSLGSGGPRAYLRVTTFQGSARFAIAGSIEDGPGANGVIASTNLVAGQTYFVAGVLNFANSTTAIYVNGVQENFGGVLGWGGNSLDAPNKYAEIGSAAVAPNVLTQRYFPGAIDGVRIFSRALADTEIANLYANPDAVPEPATWLIASVSLGVLLTVRSRR
jgi:hypothetical protein